MSNAQGGKRQAPGARELKILGAIVARTSLSQIYFFITSVLAISTAILLGALYQMGFALLPIVHKGELFTLMFFWISILMLIIILVRNYSVGLILMFLDIIGARSNENRYDWEAWLSEKLHHASFNLKLLCTYAVFVLSFILGGIFYCLVPVFFMKVILAYAFLCLSAFTSARMIFLERDNQYPSLLFLYFSVILFFMSCSSSYITVVRSSKPDVYIQLRDKESIIAKLLMSNDKGVFFFAMGREAPLFYNWDSVRCIIPIFRPQEFTGPKDCLPQTPTLPAKSQQDPIILI